MSEITGALKPGQSIVITKRGQPLGTFVKAARPAPIPDFLANLENLGERSSSGQRIIDEICGVS